MPVPAPDPPRPQVVYLELPPEFDPMLGYWTGAADPAVAARILALPVPPGVERDLQGTRIEVRGPPEQVRRFLDRAQLEAEIGR